VWIACVLIIVAVGAAYANSLRGEFVLDDLLSIPENPTIRSLWPPFGAFAPERGTGATVDGRPVLNFSFALNYAVGGTEVFGYHLANLGIHILAGLYLFGILRRTLERTGGGPEGDAKYVAAVCALIWCLHPLQTESVSYVAQRAESLMGLLFLISLYAAIRSWGAGGSVAWTVLSLGAACLCAGTKEVAAALPILVLLYDRTFVAGSFSGAIRKSRWLYLGLACSWGILGFLALRTGDRGGTIGSRAGISHLDFALCQSRGIFHYLRLCLWPSPLVADYGADFVTFRDALPWAVLLAALLALVAWAVVKRPAFGFLGAWFFVILAPTSSFVGGTRQMLAEHRMYLPLAAVVVGAVLLLHRWLGRAGLALGLGIAAMLGVATAARNEAYRGGLSLYRDTVLHRPGNPWARNNYGLYLDRSGKPQEAVTQFLEALELRPDYPEAHINLGLALSKIPGRLDGAVFHYREAIRLKPDNPEAHTNLGNALASIPDKKGDAVAEYEEALRLNPDFADAHYDLGNVLATLKGRLPDAVAQYREAVRLRPDFVEAHINLGNALSQVPGGLGEAVAHLREAIRLRPDSPEAHDDLGRALSGTPGGTTEAIAEFREALRLNPDDGQACYNLGNVLSTMPGRLGEAISQYERAIRLRPDFADAHNRLGLAYSRTPSRLADAVAQFREAVRLAPNLAVAHFNLGFSLSQVPGRLDEAMAQYEEAVRLKPDFAEAEGNLGALLCGAGRLEEGVERFRAALRANPNLVTAHLALGAAFLKLGQPGEAADEYEIVLRLRPNDPTALRMLEAIRVSP
jgi:tetratricopeptide (TPR) repeat protein